MYYPLTVRDFLDRAAHVYPDRIAVVDEPDQPAPSLGELTYRELAANARAQAARLDELGVPVGGRVAVVAHKFTLGEDDALYLRDTEPREWAEPDEAATATINYTSGTTARPKGVQLTHRNLWLNATVFGLHMGISDRDVYLHTLPMFHAN